LGRDTSQIAQFLRDHVLEAEPGDRAVKLKLVHLQGGGARTGEELRTIVVPAAVDAEWVDATSIRIAKLAADEADALPGGVQRYAVHAFSVDTDRKALGRVVWTCQGGQGFDDGLTGTEAPTAEGLVAGAQRHTEFWARLAAGQQVSFIAQLQEELKRLRSENQDLNDRYAKQFEMMEALASAHEERSQKRRLADVKVKALENGAEKLALLLPMAINHLVGRKVLPEAAGAVLTQKAFVESIGSEDWVKLEQILRPEAMALLLQMSMAVSKPAPDEPAANGVTKSGDH
jgi:hypothetical protein